MKKIGTWVVVAEAEGIRYYKDLTRSNSYIARSAAEPAPDQGSHGTTRQQALTRYRILVSIEKGRKEEIAHV
jgi:hypothetical protein